MKISSSSEASTDNPGSGQKKQKRTNLYILLAAIIAGMLTAQLILLIRAHHNLQLPTNPLIEESKTYIHKIKHMINLSAWERLEKGSALFNAKPYTKGIEASRQTMKMKPDYEEAYSTLSSSDSILDDKNSAIEASKVIKNLPLQKNTNLHSKSYPIFLSGKEAIDKGAYNKISSENGITDKSTINNGNETDRTFYTIQAGSFKNMMNAQRQFNTLIPLSYKKEFNHLRIENIDELNVVRLGKFEGYSHALKLIKDIKQRISNAFILEAYMKDKNIIKLHKK
jgi:hypothetical protein